MNEQSYAEQSAHCIDILQQCVGEYVPGRAATRTNCQRAIDQAEILLERADAEIAALREAVERAILQMRSAANDMHDVPNRNHPNRIRTIADALFAALAGEEKPHD